ncbi:MULTISPECIES: hypothetical protein [Micrococcus]|uniref:hypothetical protein n=1 Tax=Micrococcus TaxID=1269 RepID=UPI0001C4F9AB|nr:MULTISPECIES: hypothetical protein [Micrococcus]EFD51887.1 hypothetical protein HMPREF0569_2104 [Micrococcus luteus SK58]MBM4623973.1 hypothetical protein [Micrococcus sp. JV4]MBN6768555.1 hypothetical protein [Micrococcus luteus]MBN6829287.1 hypothetical protein [Micrococcus luteus]MBN6845788.1 hypothetical protein [Micrococcus luteus]
MTMPPLHHGQPGDDGDPRDPRHRPGAGLGPGLRTVWTFVGVMFTCALIVFWTLRGFGVQRGDLSLPAALGVLALAAVAAAVITRYVRRR